MAFLTLADRLAAGDTLFSAWAGRLPHPLVTDTLARGPWDAVTLDLQHGLLDFSAMAASIEAAARAGKPSVVRIPVGDFALASRALDAGASAIIAPMINTPADARAFAAATKFPPVGSRSWGPSRALVYSGLTDREYLAAANRLTTTFAMIETVEAMENLTAILGTPGIDGVFVGPSDLSVALTGGTELNPLSARVEEALAEILAKARDAGKPAAIYSHTPERAKALARLGFRFVAVSSDAGTLAAGSSALWKALAD